MIDNLFIKLRDLLYPLHTYLSDKVIAFHLMVAKLLGPVTAECLIPITLLVLTLGSLFLFFFKPIVLTFVIFVFLGVLFSYVIPILGGSIMFDEGDIVYVEPGIGFARVMVSDAESDIVYYQLLSLAFYETTFANEDDVSKVHGEFYYDQLESLTQDLMSPAGDYKIADNVEAVLTDIRELVDAYKEALKNGQR
jgi:hypothetical protein